MRDHHDFQKISPGFVCKSNAPIQILKEKSYVVCAIVSLTRAAVGGF